MKKIFLSNSQVTLVSDEDHIFLAGYTWSPNNRGYATASVNGKTRFMHRVVVERMKLDLTGGEVDHINQDRLDNRRNNLRIATRSQNKMNCGKPRDNTSGYRGVAKDRNKWRSQIQVNGELIHLGCFDTPEEASDAYCEAAEKYFGEFAEVLS